MTIIRLIAKILQVFGIATIGAVVVLFFGKTDMQQLLFMSILGAVEFYSGTLMLSFIEK